MNVAVTLLGPTKPPPPFPTNSRVHRRPYSSSGSSARHQDPVPRNFHQQPPFSFTQSVSRPTPPVPDGYFPVLSASRPTDPLITDDDDSYGRVPLLRERVLITPESWNNLTAVDVVRSWAHQKFINEIIRKNILPLRRSLESL